MEVAGGDLDSARFGRFCIPDPLAGTDPVKKDVKFVGVVVVREPDGGMETALT